MSLAGSIASSVVVSSIDAGSGSCTSRPSTDSSAFSSAISSSSSSCDVSAGRRRSFAGTAPALGPYAGVAESVTGTAGLPVSVAQLRVSLGEYELSDEGDVVETGRTEEQVTVPLAHTEGGLTASLQRGAKAVELSGGFRTYVVADRITRASCFICRDVGDALALA